MSPHDVFPTYGLAHDLCLWTTPGVLTHKYENFLSVSIKVHAALSFRYIIYFKIIVTVHCFLEKNSKGTVIYVSYVIYVRLIFWREIWDLVMHVIYVIYVRLVFYVRFFFKIRPSNMCKTCNLCKIAMKK